MSRRLVIFVILASMVLHCFSRVGFLSFLYQQRHEIAYAIGLIAEIPIALCNGDYDFNTGLTLQSDNEQEHFPSAIQPPEIILFYDTHIISMDFRSVLLRKCNYRPYRESAFTYRPDGIFQPPRI